MKSFNTIKYRPFIALLVSIVIITTTMTVGISIFFGKHFDSKDLNLFFEKNLRLNNEFFLNDIIQKQEYRPAWIKSRDINVEVYANVTSRAGGDEVELLSATTNEGENFELIKTDGLLSYSSSINKFTVLGIGSGKIVISYAFDRTVSISLPFATAFHDSGTLSIIESNYPNLLLDGLLTFEEMQTINELVIDENTSRIDGNDFLFMSNLEKIIVSNNDLSGVLTVVSAEKLPETKIFVPQQMYNGYLTDINWSLSDRIFPDVQANEFESVVVFNLNHGEIPQSSGSDFYSTKFSKVSPSDISAYTPERDGHTFLGWFTSSDEGVTLDEQINDNHIFETDTKLYAAWRTNNYSIIYDTQGGLGSFAPQNVAYNQSVKLHEAVPVMNGYIFLGWATTPNATSVQYGNGEEIINLTKEEEAITLYAVWAGETFTVRYNANGGASKPQDQIATFGQPFTFTTDLPVKVGWTFLCWSESASEIVNRREPGDSVSNLLSMYGTSVTYYAIWMANEYTIIFEPNGGLNAPSSQVVGYNEIANLATDKPLRSGHELLGWHSQRYPVVQSLPSGGITSGEQIQNLAEINMDEIVLYAVWKNIPYVIRYDANGGTNAPADIEGVYYDQEIELSTIIPNKPFYNFLGWNTDKNATTALYEAGATVKNLHELNGIAILYAIWRPNDYQIEFITRGSEIPNQVASYDQTIYLPAAATREGHTFLGWDLNESALVPQYQPGDSVINLTQVEGATISIYAIWSVHKYSIIYNANDGTGAPAAEFDIAYDVAFRLSSIQPTRTDYIFAGWGLTRTVVLYQAGETVSNLSSQDGDTIVLYAVWQNVVRYDVSYNGNGGSAIEAVHTNILYNTTFLLTTQEPTRKGYSFLGWSRNESDTTQEFTPGELVSNLTNIEGKKLVLYAIWRAHTYTIEYSVGNGSAVQAQTATYGEQIQLRHGSVLEGRSSLYWDDKENGKQYIANEWVLNLTSVDGAIIRLTATAYEITWINYDGSILGTNWYWHGATPKYGGATPSRTKSVQYEYTFKGWGSASQLDSSWNENTTTIQPASQKISYHVVFTRSVRKYTITWNGDGVWQTKYTEEPYGQTPNAPSFPSIGVNTKERYDHTGWTTAIQIVTGDATYVATYKKYDDTTCIIEGTLITMADGSQKPVEELNEYENILVWDFENGEYSIAPVLLIDKHYGNLYVVELIFEDGTKIGVTFSHSFFSISLKRFVEISEHNAESYIGESFKKLIINEDGTYDYRAVRLIDVKFETRLIRSFNITSALSFTHYADGILAGPGGVGARILLNIFEVDETLKWDTDKMENDINTYGLFEYEEYADYVSYEIFVLFNAKYMKILVGKEITTVEEILEVLSVFLNSTSQGG